MRWCLIKELENKIVKFAEERDWLQFNTPENLAKSIAIEAGELLECFQWNNDYNNFVTNVYPFFGRGGVYGNSNSSGIFSVDNITHGALRLCLTF